MSDLAARALGRTAINIDLKKILESYDRRIYQVEQFATSPGLVIGSNEFDTIVVGGEVISGSAPNAVTGVTATPDTFFDSIFVDIEWTPGVGGEPANTFDVEFSLGFSGGTLIDIFSTAGTNLRINGLQGNTQYSIRVTPVSRIGVRGTPSSWVNFTSGIDTGVPPAPTGVVLARGATTVIVKYTPLTAAQAPDVANGNGIYEIEIDTSNLFNTGNLKSMRTDAQIVSFSDIFSELTWYGRVRAVDMVGNVGPWSAVSAAMSGGGILDSMILAGLDAAKITVGFLSASRIQAGTLTADKLTTSSLTSANITLSGGSLKAGNPPSAAGLLVNSQGLHLYNTGGLRKIYLDAATGTGTFEDVIVTGNITATAFRAVNGPQLIPNGYFETDITGWVATDVATLARIFSGGTWWLEITIPIPAATGAGARTNKIAVDPDYGYSFSIKVGHPGTEPQVEWVAKVYWYTSADVLISSEEIGKYNAVTAPLAKTIVISDRAIPPATAAKFEFSIERTGTTTSELRKLAIDEVVVTSIPVIEGGTFKQAISGKRVEAVELAQLDFYSGLIPDTGDVAETAPASIKVDIDGSLDRHHLLIESGQLGTGDKAFIDLWSENSDVPTESYMRLDAYTIQFSSIELETAYGSLLPDDWVAPTLINSWINYGSGWQTARYRKTDVGQTVEIQGLVKSGIVGNPIFTLPVGFRPPGHLLFATDSDAAHARLDIESNTGHVRCQQGGNGYFSINCKFSINTGP